MASTQATAAPVLKGSVGAYKELAYGAYDKQKELDLTAKFGAASYPNYLPVWDNEKGEVYKPLEPFEHYEHGKDADPTFPNLLKEGTVIDDITASIGAEVKGVQLSQLNDAGKDELALLVAQKKVVAFRDQDLASLPIEQALDLGRYFGRIHIHPTRYIHHLVSFPPSRKACH